MFLNNLLSHIKSYCIVRDGPAKAGSGIFEYRLDISSRLREIILAGGLLNFTKLKHGK